MSCVSVLQDVDERTVDCQLYLRRAVDSSFRVYTLVAENIVASRSFRVPLLHSEFTPAPLGGDRSVANLGWTGVAHPPFVCMGTWRQR